MSYSIRYKQAIEALDGPLTSEDGVSASEISAGERRLGARLPSALREFYLTAGRLDQLNRSHNRLYSPQEWFVDADKLVFMEENQVVVFWSIAISQEPDDDPPVLQGINAIDMPIEWHPEDARCSAFLLIMLHWQAVCGGLKFTGMADISSVTLTRIRAGWLFVGEMGGLIAFTRDGAAACVIGEGEARQLFVGGRTEVDFNLINVELARMDVKLNRA